jgi:hypothetical protein
LSFGEAESLVHDPERVARNAFFPFIYYEQNWQPFRTRSEEKPPKKSRLIRYGARRDAYIFTRYRHKLSNLYEAKLNEAGISHVPIAYRRFNMDDASRKGASKIEFAKKAFDFIKETGSCYVILSDISQFFESLDHQKIKRDWNMLLETEYLPKDHYAVLKAVTQYSYVEYDRLCRRLGFIKTITRNGRQFSVPVPPKNRKQLCSPREFRKKVCGEDPSFSDIVEKNPTNHGVPQGCPLADLIANVYLFDFDKRISTYIESLGGLYMRYSDDIFIAFPDNEEDPDIVKNLLLAEIRKQGANIDIKEEKTSIYHFRNVGNYQRCFQHHTGAHCNGIAYLGFRYDGKYVYLKDATVARFYRKLTRAIRTQAFKTANRFPGKDANFVYEHMRVDQLLQRFGRVEDFRVVADQYRSWTFWTYVKRAAKVFPENERRFFRQVAGYRKRVRRWARQEAEKAVRKRIERLGV